MRRQGSFSARFPYWKLKRTVMVGNLVILVGANRALSATNDSTSTYGHIAVSVALSLAAVTYVKRRTQAHLKSAQRAHLEG